MEGWVDLEKEWGRRSVWERERRIRTLWRERWEVRERKEPWLGL